ncbi:nicotinate-nucleotide adenylyltransferase [Bacillus tuaregi]|uniref:nicotinate-nucleotide adenylyltransferase n=1 Tax=Bacillus tuaregi TaxID=1816695 RepID=UPI0008F94E54|nr:nicotinate-nucleotide adenylyltransferase [Bacillus tuaregi]
MKKIGILGGTFNPPHLGHLIIANEVQIQLEFDEIWFMPNQEPPHKETLNGVSGQHRAEMIRRAIANNPKFKLQLIELERPGRSYTYDTMKLLTEKNDDRFYFIIGADMIEYLPNWYKIEELVQLVTFVGVNRPEYDKQSDYPIIYVDVPNIEISSLMIRNRIKNGKNARYFIPDSVMEYIEENRLYET